MERLWLFVFTDDSLFAEIKIKGRTEVDATRLLELMVNLNGSNIRKL